MLLVIITSRSASFLSGLEPQDVWMLGIGRPKPPVLLPEYICKMTTKCSALSSTRPFLAQVSGPQDLEVGSPIPSITCIPKLQQCIFFDGRKSRQRHQDQQDAAWMATRGVGCNMHSFIPNGGTSERPHQDFYLPSPMMVIFMCILHHPNTANRLLVTSQWHADSGWNPNKIILV